jgi:hypothetical protein
MLFGYIGPETMLPLVSVFAGAVGVFMMLSRGVMRFARTAIRGLRFRAGRK